MLWEGAAPGVKFPELESLARLGLNALGPSSRQAPLLAWGVGPGPGPGAHPGASQLALAAVGGGGRAPWFHCLSVA